MTGSERPGYISLFFLRCRGTMWAGGTMDSARSVDTSPTMCPQTCMFVALAFFAPASISRPPFINVLCFSPFLSLSRPGRPLYARVTISRGKGCLFCKSAKLVKVTSLAYRASRQGRKGRLSLTREREKDVEDGMVVA